MRKTTSKDSLDASPVDSGEEDADSKPDNNLLENVLEYLTQGVVIFDSASRLLTWNKQFETALDFPKGFLKPGMSNWEMMLHIAKRGDLGTGNPEKLAATRLDLLWGDDHLPMDITIKGEKTYEVSFNGTDDGGRVMTYTDITQSRNAEEVLRQSERRFRTLYYQSPTGVSLEDYSKVKIKIDQLSKQGVTDFRKYFEENENDLLEILKVIKLLDANDSLIEMLGASSFEEFQRYEESFETFTNANWRNFYVCEIAALASGEVTYIDEFADFKMDGTPIYLRCTSRVVRGREHDWSEIITTHEDITASKQAEEKLERHRDDLQELVKERTAKLAESEERFRAIAETASDWFWETDEEFRFTFISERFFEVSDIHPNDVIGKSRLEFITPDHWIRNPKKWHRHTDDLEAHLPFSISYWVESRRGKKTCIEIKGKPIFDADSCFTGYRGAGTDVTAAVLAKDKLTRAKEAADAANKAKSEFLASMSHELRTPLNAIIGFSNTIKDEVFGPVDNPKYIEYSKDILSSGEHLLELINDILDVSAIEAGKVELVEEVIDIPEIVRSCLYLIQQRANDAEISIGIDLQEELPALRADERRVKQILINLLSNSVKFTPRGKDIKVASQLNLEGGLVLSVTDTGIGMTQDELAHAMTRFGQVETGPQRMNEGTGLGLTLTKGLVDLHGGFFNIESKKDYGTKVSVTFPAERVLTK